MSKSEHDVGITDNRDSRKTPRLTRLLINLAADESDTLRQRARYSAAIQDPRTLRMQSRILRARMPSISLRGSMRMAAECGRLCGSLQPRKPVEGPRTLLYAIDALYVNGVPSLAMVFIESPIFTADVTELLSDEEYAKLQEHLAQRPKAGALITQTGGLRKVRWRVEGGGKRGGVRVIYYHVVARAQIRMILIYRKGTKDDLTPREKTVLRKMNAEW